MADWSKRFVTGAGGLVRAIGRVLEGGPAGAEPRKEDDRQGKTAWTGGLAGKTQRVTDLGIESDSS